jgi:hypothetical protein
MMPEAGFGLSIDSWDDKYFVQPFHAGLSLPAKPLPSKLSLFGEQRAESREQRELKILYSISKPESRPHWLPPPASIRTVVSAGATALLGGRICIFLERLAS